METINEEELDRIIREKGQNKHNHTENKKKSKKNKSIFKKILIILLIFMVIGASSLIFLLYGPYHGFRDWLITTSMTTMTHQWIAKMFYSDETIKEVMSRNRVEEIKEDTDTSSINTEKKNEEEIKEYENE